MNRKHTGTAIWFVLYMLSVTCALGCRHDSLSQGRPPIIDMHVHALGEDGHYRPKVW